MRRPGFVYVFFGLLIALSFAAVFPAIAGFGPPQGSGGSSMPVDPSASVGITTLIDNTATTVLSVVTADGDMTGMTVHYTIQATDGIEYQSEHGKIMVAIVDDADGVVVDVSEFNALAAKAVSDGTLTSSWSAIATDDQLIEIQLSANTSLTPTTLQVSWRLKASDAVAIVVP